MTEALIVSTVRTPITKAAHGELNLTRGAAGIDPDLLNVNCGAIAMGHPFGMTGARQVGHILIEGKRRGARYGIVSMCVAGGTGAAGLLEMF